MRPYDENEATKRAEEREEKEWFQKFLHNLEPKKQPDMQDVFDKVDPEVMRNLLRWMD